MVCGTAFSGKKKKIQVRSKVSSAKELYNIEEKGWKSFGIFQEKEIQQILESRKSWDLGKEYRKLREKQIRFVPFFSEQYPKRLMQIPDMPYALYVKGNLPSQKKSAAIVGARKNTYYGEYYTLQFSKYLAERKIEIISGLALGIDGYAHRGALEGGGKTFAVLGCGADICYPREHFGLYMDILENGGGILSEYIPETRPAAYYFPLRNRIISGLSDIIMVMEAKEKSGSLITADLALEQGKEVYALPGSLDRELSLGCNRLISQGAGMLLSPEELCQNLECFGENYINNSYKHEIILENAENLVYNRLGLEPKNLEELAIQTGLRVSELTSLLVVLELKGVVKEISKHHYVKVI